tara:strand:- start:9477 stop:9716 length:240 start_codon:yes stop_codon:yes gene_type:complete
MIVDDLTCKCLAVIPDISISGACVVRELTAVIEQRGKPEVIDSDNGAEFNSYSIFEWSKDQAETPISGGENFSGRSTER